VKAHRGKAQPINEKRPTVAEEPKRYEGKQPTGAETSKKDEIEYTYKNKKLH